mgnify:CR=1 FL=1
MFYQRLMLKTRRQIFNIARAHLCITPPRCRVHVYLAMATIIAVVGTELTYATETEGELIQTETVSGEGVWIDPRLNPSTPAGKNKTGQETLSKQSRSKSGLTSNCSAQGMLISVERRSSRLQTDVNYANTSSERCSNSAKIHLKELRMRYGNYKSKESFQISNHTGSSMVSHAPPHSPVSPNSSPSPE